MEKGSTKSKVRIHERLFISCILINIIVIEFYGIIIKYTYNNMILFNIKTYIPEFVGILALIFISFYNRNKSINKYELIFSFYMIFILILNLLFQPTYNSVMMTVRDVIFPLIILIVLSNNFIREEPYEVFMKYLFMIEFIFAVSTLALGLVELYRGWEWTCKFYVDYTFWGQDNISKLMISSNDEYLRVPGTTGSSVKCGTYSLISFIIAYEYNNIKYKLIRIITIICSIVNILIYNNRSSLVALIVLFFLIIIRSQRINIKIKNILKIAAILTAVISVVGIQSKFASIIDRIENWKEFVKWNLLRNIFIPLNTFNFSAAGDELGIKTFTNVWDNGYLFFIYSFGIIGMFLIVKILYKQFKFYKLYIEKRNIYRNISSDLLICLIVLSFTTNIFLGRAYFGMFVIIFGIQKMICNSMRLLVAREK